MCIAAFHLARQGRECCRRAPFYVVNPFLSNLWTPKLWYNVYVQAVALGAAVQAGILEGQVSNVMVMDIWQASLMRAYAKQRLKEDKELARAQGISDDAFSDDDFSDDSFSDGEVKLHSRLGNIVF